jgi:hypothetical protein
LVFDEQAHGLGCVGLLSAAVEPGMMWQSTAGHGLACRYCQSGHRPRSAQHWLNVNADLKGN